RAVGGEAILMPVDLSEPAKLVSLGPVLFQRFGRLDIFVANAAELGQLSATTHADPKHWDKVLAVNLTANQRLAATLDPLLRAAPGGQAIFITDGTATGHKAYWSAYGATKTALAQMAAAWALEVVPPLRIRTFDPGPMSTKLRGKAFPGETPGTPPSRWFSSCELGGTSPPHPPTSSAPSPPRGEGSNHSSSYGFLPLLALSTSRIGTPSNWKGPRRPFTR